MSVDNLDRLAEVLAADLAPGKTLRHPALRALGVFLPALVWVAGAVLFIGLRPDFTAMLEQGTYVAELLFILTIAGSAAVASSWLAVPGRKGQAVALTIPLALVAIFVFLLGMQAAGEGFHVPTPELLRCPLNGLVMATVPVAAFIVLMRGGATTRPRLAAFMNMLAVAALGWAGLRMTCPANNVSHTFFYHFLPFLAVGGVFGALARRLYRW